MSLTEQNHNESESEETDSSIPRIEIAEDQSTESLDVIPQYVQHHQFDACAIILQFRDKVVAQSIRKNLKENGFLLEEEEYDTEIAPISTTLRVQEPHLRKILDSMVISMPTSMMMERAKSLPFNTDLSAPYRCLELLHNELNCRLPDLDREIARGNCILIPIHDMNMVSSLHVNAVDKIAAYFGPEVASYFGFMEFYMWRLFYGSIFGTALSFNNKVVTRIGVDDNPFYAIYGICMIFWGAAFCICWSRHLCVLQYGWGVLHPAMYTPPDAPRPNFWGSKRISPIIGELELYYPWSRRFWKYVVSATVSALFLAVGLFFMICSMNAQGHVEAVGASKVLYMPTLAKLSEKGGYFYAENRPFLGLIPRHLIITIFHVGVIKTLNNAYGYVSTILVEFENHRTQKDHESSLIWKRFFFQCLDCFGSLCFLAFVKCNVLALRTELMSLYSVDTSRRFLFETFVPLAKQVIRGRRSLTAQLHLGQAKLRTYESFEDWQEVITQYGYIILFASAFPLGPLFSLLANEVERRHDLFKLKYLYRRPIPRNDLGPWTKILYTLTLLSVLTNSAIVSLSSDQLSASGLFPAIFNNEIDDLGATFFPDMGQWGVAICFLLEHILGAAVLLIWHIVPSTPEVIANNLAREAYTTTMKEAGDEGKVRSVSNFEAVTLNHGREGNTAETGSSVISALRLALGSKKKLA